jgi:phospholipid transport system substrate-binding protein
VCQYDNINKGKLMFKRLTAMLGAVTFVAAGMAYAQTAPDALVKTTVDEVLGVLKTSKDRRVLSEVVEKKVLPHFDFQAMTRLAVGRHWREASPTQQQSLENAFRALLVTTYTQALTQANTTDQSVEVRPAAVKPADDDVTVKTFVKDTSRKALAIDYRLSKAANGWKVYDVVVENLSLVTNYRSSFSSEIAKSGIDGLIKALEAKNKQNAAG